MTLKEMIFADRTKIKSYWIIAICVICVLLCPQLASAQTRTIDSLRLILKTSAQDTNYVNALSYLALQMGQNNPDTAITICNTAQSLSQKLKWKKGAAIAELRIGAFNVNKTNDKEALIHYNNAMNICETLLSSKDPVEILTGKSIKGKILGNMANIYKLQANYPKALECCFLGAKISEEVGDKAQVGRTFCNIATIYYYQSAYPEALEYYFKGLKIAETDDDKYQLARTFGNIANVYADLADFTKALEYYSRGLKIYEGLGDKRGMGIQLGNIGSLYKDQSSYSKSLECFFRSLKMSEEVGNKGGVAVTLGNIANIYKAQGDSAVTMSNAAFARTDKYPKALEYYFKGLKITADKYSVGLIYGNMGSLYTNCGKYKEAEDHLKKALLMLKELGAEDLVKTQHENLFVLFEKTNRPALALEHYKKFIALRDTIFSQENSKKLMRSEMDHEYEKKKAVTDAEHNLEIQNQKLIADEKNKKQNIIIGSVIAGLILVMVFAGFIFRSLRITAKQKQIIELKNMETEHQKKEIEQHQKEILDSIHYAKRIQMAQIPSEKRVQSMIRKLKRD